MKKLVYISLIGLLLTTACKKDGPILKRAELPFENESIKLELVATSLPVTIRDIFFINASKGFAATSYGEIYTTSNYGVNWELNFTNPIINQPFFQLLFTDASVGYVVGGSTSCGGTGCIPPGGIILKTTDGGKTWATILQVPGVEFVSIAANSLGELFAISNGTKGWIYKSTNAGNTWSTINSVDYQLQKIYFNNATGFLTGNNGNIFRSSDNGITWNLASKLNAEYATDIKFSNANGFCIANNKSVYKTIDNGTSWTESLNYENGFKVLNPLTANTCLVFGAGIYSGGDFGFWNCRIMHTNNAGNTWNELVLKEFEVVRVTSFYAAEAGYALAGNKLLKITIK